MTYRLTSFVLTLVTASILTGCGADLSAKEACEKVEPDLTAAAEDGDFEGGASALREVADESNDDVAEVFDNAAVSLDYFAENGNEGIAPDSINEPLDDLDATCEPVLAP
jgi:hypothetical protein